MKKAVFLLTTIFTLAIAANAQGLAVGATIEDFSLPMAGKGNITSLKEQKGKNGAVVMFLSAQCPVVKGYIERINAVADDYKARGITFIGINSNATESPEWVASDASQNFRFPMLIDKGNKLADKLGATVTPEAYYIDAKNVLVYHGAIDNDRSGESITDTYLRTAFDQSLAGQKVTNTRKNAFGCSIKKAAAEK